MKNLTAFLLSVGVLFGSVACSDVAKTSADAPDNPNEAVEEPSDIDQTKGDAENEVRQKQLESDDRARDERNEALDQGEAKDDDDLASQVRDRLEANLSGSKLSVEAEEGVVNIFGTVSEDKEYTQIEPLAKEVEGVKTVKLDVKVVAPDPAESE